jgi:fluoroquinolone resistance protein
MPKTAPQAVTCDAHFGAADGSSLTIVNTQFEDCSFSHCLWPERDMKGAKFIDCLFDTCDMAVARVTDCTFARVRFKDCRLSGIVWSVSRKIESVVFENCHMNDGTFLDVRLECCEFTNCTLHRTSFRESKLLKASFRGTDLSGGEFVNCDLREADFRGASGYQIGVFENQIQDARFSLPEAVSLLRSIGIPPRIAGLAAWRLSLSSGAPRGSVEHLPLRSPSIDLDVVHPSAQDQADRDRHDR